ncbi:LysR substrate-binding domain-containing protein [Labrys neptuniae]
MSSTYLDIRSLRAFVLTVETGSLTEASRRMGRTQSAVTQQIQKLEQIIGRPLFDDTRRMLELSEAGTVLLSHARRILSNHDECLARFAPAAAEEKVVFGVPDLYATFLLPPILSAFRRDYPHIRIELRCALSRPLVARVREGSIDIALVTRMDGFTGGQVVSREQLVWLTGATSSAHFEDPVPMALLPPGNIYRDYAINALDRAGRDWRIACVSDSISGLQTAVLSGIAVTVLIGSALVPGLRQPPAQAGLPPLPSVDLLLYRSATEHASSAVETLHRYLLNHLSLVGGK